MTTTTVQLRSIPDTEAAVGWSGAHTIVVDRPDGKAGGKGLGFNGGQLLGLAIGGCFCNDLQYVAHEMGHTPRVTAGGSRRDFEGTPLIATQAVMRVNVTASEKDAGIAALIKRARDISAVANTLKRGLSVETIVNKDG
ncbi:MAG TPA: OsmC family protein [Roseiarcus sp.]|nr:OsmC family protein [Roseiarcus sp.]